MSNYIEIGEKIAFHPGYYIEEIVEYSGLTQEDYAKRLDTTPKNLSELINGNQRLSIDMASKLSRLMGTSVEYWLNLQCAYDSLIGERNSQEVLREDREVLRLLRYSDFRDLFGLPDLPRRISEQIYKLRELFEVSSLTVLRKPSLAVNFRRSRNELNEQNIVRANAMIQIAINRALEMETEKFNEEKFREAIDYGLTLTTKHGEFLPLLRERFGEAGVAFVVLPNLPGSKINGATKKLENKIMLMVSDRNLHSDIFWFTLFHEIGHILAKDHGVSYAGKRGDKETKADVYAKNKLIPQEKYEHFVSKKNFTVDAIIGFAKEIDRDPGLVLGRLRKDEYVPYDSVAHNQLVVNYKVVPA